MENVGYCSNTESSEQSLKDIRKVAWVGLSVNVVLSTLKFLLGFFGNSSALIADAAHSFSDVTTDIAILLGAKYWTAPPDQKHPYGHKRLETLVTLIIGVFLVIAGLGIGYRAIFAVHGSRLQQPDWLALTGALISIVVKEVLFQWSRRQGKRLNSQALIANAWHNRSDALSSIPVAAAIIVAMAKPQWAYIDSVGALIVCVFILYTSWGILKPALLEISERGASAEDCDKIKIMALQIDGVKSVHAVRTRWLGGGVMADLHRSGSKYNSSRGA